jgi:hypothetical protein
MGNLLRACAAALLMAVAPAAAQVKSYSDFKGGLNTRNSGVLLQDNESPSLQNVLLDANGGVTRRQGYSKVNPAALGGGASDVNAVYQLEQSGGSKYCVSFSSTSGYYSTDGCATSTVFVSTLTRNSDVNCTPYADKLYCVNNQYNFSFDGRNHVSIASAPTDLDFIKAWRDRCFGAGKDTNPSRLYWSQLGTCDLWDPTVDYVDLDAEDGDIITGIGLDLFDRLVVYKKFSTYLLQFDNANPNNRRLINVSKTTGAKNGRAVASFDNRQFFLSVGPYGGQPGVYSTDGINIQEESANLRGSIDLLSNFFSNTGRRTIDTKADWDAGTFDPYALSSSRDSGFMQSSYTAVTQTTSSDWAENSLPNLSTSSVSGSVALQATEVFLGTFTWATAYNNGSVSVTTVAATVNASPGTSGNATTAVTPYSVAYGTFTFHTKCSISAATGFSMRAYFINSSNSANTFGLLGNGYSIAICPGCSSGFIMYLARHAANTNTKLVSLGSSSPCGAHDWTVYRSSSSGAFSVYDGATLAGTATDTTYTSSGYVGVDVTGSGSNHTSATMELQPRIFYGPVTSTAMTSKVFDMGVSTPTWGPFTATYSSSTETSLSFQTQSSSDGVTFCSLGSQTPGQIISAPNMRYLRYKASFSSNNSTMTPHLDAVTVSAASTGTWTSPELFLSNSMTSFGIFRADQSTDGSGSIAYAMKFSTYAGGTASTGTVVVVPNLAINHSTAAYVVVIATFTIYSASETAKIDSIAINWNEGNAAKSATMAVYKNRLHVCGQSAASTINDVCYVRDMGGAWVKWTGVNSRYLGTVGQNFLSATSSETGGGFVYRLYDTDSDDGNPINAYWESKDHVLGPIQNVMAVDRVYLLGSNDATTLNMTLKADSGMRTQAFDMDLSTGAAFRVKQKPIYPALSGNSFRLRVENNAASKPWSFYGYGFLSRDLGMMQP